MGSNGTQMRAWPAGPPESHIIFHFSLVKEDIFTSDQSFQRCLSCDFCSFLTMLEKFF